MGACRADLKAEMDPHELAPPVCQMRSSKRYAEDLEATIGVLADAYCAQAIGRTVELLPTSSALCREGRADTGGETEDLEDR